MASAVRMVRPAREAPTVTAVLLRVTAVKKVIARLAVSLSLVLAMKLPATSRPMEAVARMARPVRAVSLETVALSTATVARATPSAAMVTRRPLVSAPVSHPTLSVVPGTARLVLDLDSETVAHPMDTVEAPPLTVDRAGKFTISIISISLLTLLLSSQKGASSACLTKDIPSLDSTCGSKASLTCAGGPFNGQCCGSTGFCGTTSTHCGANW
jgi:hypothetical protein